MVENNTNNQTPAPKREKIAVSQKTTEIILALATLIALLLGVYFFFGRKKLVKPVVGPSPAVHKELPASSPKTFNLPNQPEVKAESSFVLQTEKTVFTNGETFNLNVIANANGEKVDGVEFVLTYNPKMVSIGIPVFGKFFSLYPQKNVDNTKGEVKIIALEKPGENKALNSETVVTLPVTVIKQGQITISFATGKNHIAAYGGQELLKEALPLTITVE